MATSRRRPLVALALATALAGAVPAGASAAPPAPTPPPPPVFTDASVHDPSVVVADDELWVFGSHLAAARSDDLIGWEQVANGVSADNPLFDDVRAELAETFRYLAPRTPELRLDGRPVLGPTTGI